MGNRSTVFFGDGDHGENLATCLVWNGGPESVYAFLKALSSYKLSQNPSSQSIAVDPSSMATRFNQLVCNYFSDSSSDFLSVHQAPNPGAPGAKHLPTEHGYFYARPDFSVERFDYDGRKWSQEERLAEFIDVAKHRYWTDDDSLLSSVREANDKAFLRRFHPDGKVAQHAFQEATLPVEAELAAKLAASAANKKSSAMAP